MKFSPTAFAGHCFFMLLILAVMKRWRGFLQDCRDLWQEKKRNLLLLAAASIISINWLTYIHVIYSSITHSCFLVSLS